MSNSLGERLLEGRGIALGSSAFVALWLAFCGQNGQAQAAEIVARIDGEIITERDMTERSVLLQKRLAKIVPSLRIDKEDRKSFALDLLLQESLQKRYLEKERALPVTESAVKERLSLLATDTTERRFLEDLARHELTWEGYVGRVADFNNPVTPQDAFAERARLRAIATEPRYRLEEIFLPRLEAGEATRRVSEALYRSVYGGRSFARVANILPAPYAREGLGQVLYKSELPSAVSEALEQGKVGASGIVAPVRSPYGVHLYRVQRQRDRKKTTRYDFIQTFFLPSVFGARQADILSRAEFCATPQEVSLSLEAYDLQTFEDIPEADLTSETRRFLSGMSRGETAGPFPFEQDLIVLVTLCNKRESEDRGDTFQELTRRLILQRARALSMSLVENLRAQANIASEH